VTAPDERYQRALERVDAKQASCAHALAFIVVTSCSVIVAGVDWLWSPRSGGIGLALKGWYVFLEGSSRVKDREQRQVEREMAEDRPPDSTKPERPGSEQRARGAVASARRHQADRCGEPMTKVDETEPGQPGRRGEVSTEDQQEGADAAELLTRYTGPPVPEPESRALSPVRFWRSAVGKKWLMAVSGIVLLGYVLAHMVGNLKVYLGANDLDHYAEWLRDLGDPVFPRTVVLWGMRVVLIAAFVVHIVAAAQLTAMNRRARPVRYQSQRDYVSANFASRTMRWTGVIVALFLIFHLLDLTWGSANPDFVRGSVYDNVIASFQRVPVAIVYIVANIALGIHIFHGAWSMFQSLGINNPRFNIWQRYFAGAFAGVIVVGNVSMPLLVVTGVVG
jgi:succinate dehydrogenase / fumarate reductase, cytochrome b subunit